MSTLAIIPARAGSKRLPGKNSKPFLGRPLIQWTIAFAQRAQCFSRTVVSTDSDEIAQCAQDAGLAVAQRRPAHLASDSATSVEVALYVLAQTELLAGETFDLVALLQPTSPLRDVQRWSTAFQRLRSNACDAAVAVSPMHHHPALAFAIDSDGLLSAWSPQLPRGASHELAPAVAPNGSLYLIRAETLRREQTFFPVRTSGILCDRAWEAIDIDTEADWVAAEAFARHYGITE